MQRIYYVGMDLHKKSVSFYIKLGDGSVVRYKQVAAQRVVLRQWVIDVSAAHF